MQSDATHEWIGGETYGPGTSTHYHVLAGTVIGSAPGDNVEVWFEGGGATSDSFTYGVASDTGNRLLVVAAEDYTGASPASPGQTSAVFLSFYTDALTANGVEFDVYDVDANGRTAPDNVGVLSYYDAVIFYTGNDVVTREPGCGGNASRLAMQELNELRDFMHRRGRSCTRASAPGSSTPTRSRGRSTTRSRTGNARADPAIFARCLPLAGSGDGQGDIVEYWLGAAITTAGGGLIRTPTNRS